MAKREYEYLNSEIERKKNQQIAGKETLTSLLLHVAIENIVVQNYVNAQNEELNKINH
jgi:hypothetical protein